MGSWLVVVVIALAGCDVVLGLDRPCEADVLGSTCSTCGGDGQTCCAGTTTCGEGLVCGDGTCTACGGPGQACCAETTTCGDGLFCGDRDGDGDETCGACVVDVALGRRHMCSVRYDGTVWCSGQNPSSQLGQPESPTSRTAEPVKVEPLNDIVAVGAGRDVSCAIRGTDGSVWCWGKQSQGRLGNGVTAAASISVPVQVKRIGSTPLTGIVSVSAGQCHACARDNTGHAWCWGCNSDGELGDGTTMGRPFAGELRTAGPTSAPFADIAELSVGHNHSCLRTQAGEAWCWGADRDGQIGNGPTPLTVPLTPPRETLPVKILDRVATVAAGSLFSCASTLEGGAYCWGRASGDRLGSGETEQPKEKDLPSRVVTALGGAPFAEATQISAGTVACVSTRDTGLWCWGKDVYGTTGTGGGSTVPAPVLDADGAPIMGGVRLFGHYAHTCAQLATGAFVCWGRNTSGELANGTFAHTGTPTTVGLTCP